MNDARADARLRYTLPVERLKRGHSFGNAQAYLTLDANSDVIHEPSTARLGMRDAWDQRYYLLGWQVELVGAEGRSYEPVQTSFHPECQVTVLRLGEVTAEKKFVLPFENNLLRSAHILFTTTAALDGSFLRSRMVLPAGTIVAEATQGEHRYLAVKYAHGVAGLLWASGNLRSVTSQAVDRGVECVAEFEWPAGKEGGISFAYAHGGQPPIGAVHEAFASDAGTPSSHLRRVKVIAEETRLAVEARLDTCRLWTPDAFITDGTHWAKINQLKDWQEYRRGPGFSNSPPSDVLVGRDTFWFLVGTDYYAPAWSRRLLEFWFRDGIEANGKFVEYMLASTEPLFRDDYGLNVNDNTPLLIISVHHYYAISGDRGFLDSVATAVFRAANYLLAQRNDDGLVWCRTRDVFVRGLCGWRNCTGNYHLSGAVTEINAECYASFRSAAELADVLGDRALAQRFTKAADDLRAAMNRHLRSDSKQNPFYLMMVDPDGVRRDDLTADLLFPALFGVAPPAVGRAMVERLFGPSFWRGAEDGAGGICTISPEQKGFEPRADPATYGLQGGVWPNLALWAAHAAAQQGQADLVVQALRATRLLADRSDFDRCNVTPGEFPEYFNADDLVQRGHPRSTFIHGSYLWTAWEGLLGLAPHARGLEVNPVLPTGWNWVALSRMPYRGRPLTLLAMRTRRTLYTTARVKTKWKQVIVSAERQDEFKLEADGPVFWLVAGAQVIVAADAAVKGRLIERGSSRAMAEFELKAGEISRISLRAMKPKRKPRQPKPRLRR